MFWHHLILKINVQPFFCMFFFSFSKERPRVVRKFGSSLLRKPPSCILASPLSLTTWCIKVWPVDRVWQILPHYFVSPCRGVIMWSWKNVHCIRDIVGIGIYQELCRLCTEKVNWYHKGLCQFLPWTAAAIKMLWLYQCTCLLLLPLSSWCFNYRLEK